jgi:hypothetical protein
VGCDRNRRIVEAAAPAGCRIGAARDDKRRRETNYGTYDPSETVIAAIVGDATLDVVKICNAAMAANAEVIDLHDVAARLPALVKIKRDLEYRTPHGLPLANITLTREQCIELLTHIENMR